MLSKLLQASVRAGAQRLAAAAQLVRVSPDVLTLVGLLLSMVAAALVALDLMLPAGVVLLVGGSFDILDGAVARARGRTGKFGAFLDSTADRFGEAAVFVGLLYLFLIRLHQDVPVFLVVAALTGSLLVSYVRARAQSLGFTCDSGWFARPERLVVTAIGLIVNQMVIVLWILAIGTNLTTFQRIHTVWAQQRRPKSAAHAGPVGPSKSTRRSQEERGTLRAWLGSVWR